MRFFEFIRINFGIDRCNLLKQCIKLFVTLRKLQLKLRFLKGCLKHDIVPPHLNYLLKSRIHVFNNYFNATIYRKNLRHVFGLLRLELRDTYRHFYHVTHMIFNVTKQISNSIPIKIYNSFISCQELTNNRLFMKHCKIVDSRIDWLIKKNRESLKSQLKPIVFYASSGNFKKISATPNEVYNKKIEITTKNFDTNNKNLQIHEKWFINFTNVIIPEEVKRLLQLGEKFSLKNNKYDKNVIEFIKHLELNLMRIDNNKRQSIINQSVNVVSRLKNVKLDDYDKMFLRLYSATKGFVNDHPEIIFMGADKGNITVAMFKAEYLEKMEGILSDSNTYQKIHKDPTRSMTLRLNELLKRWKKSEFICPAEYKYMLSTDGMLPRAYGLPKVHKDGCPLRIIVSCLHSPLYNIANFLQNIISKNIKKPKSFIKNSYDLVKKLENIKLKPSWELVSLDVVSLFTNIPTDLVKDSITKRWSDISQGTSIPLDEFLMGVEFILQSTFFMFNGALYKQIFGTPMGSPLSPVVADIVMQDIEERGLASLNFSLPLYLRYVDDILLAASPQQHNVILRSFNALHDRLQFTMEKSMDNEISFLDVSIKVDSDGFIFDWHRKNTFSGRYLNYYSQHPTSHKIGVVRGMVEKVLNISDPSFFQKNLELVVDILLQNNYPIQFIFSTMEKGIKKYIYNNKRSESVNEKEKEGYFIVPYVKNISDRFISIANSIGLKTAFSVDHSLRRFIKTNKDRVDRGMLCNVVYKLKCQSCPATYVGQTKRQLRTRINEHRKDIKKISGEFSVISNHRLKYDHDFAWDDAEICDVEASYSKRLTSEMVYIKKQTLPLNKQSDTEFLPPEYSSLLL